MRSRRRPWLTLLAIVAAGGANAQETAPPAAEPAAASSFGGFAGLLDYNWGARILTSGSLSYDLRATRASGDSNSRSQLVTASLTGRSYLYQPWFATITGNVRLTTSVTHTTYSGDPQLVSGPTTNRDQFISGGVRVNVFPRSRFPFELHAEHSDSRNDSGLANGVDFRSDNIGFSQRYRPLDGRFSVSGNYDFRNQSGAGFHDNQHQFATEFNTRWKNNELSLGGSFSRARRLLTDESSEFRSAVARHSYAPGGALSISSTAQITQTLEQARLAPADLTVMQFSSVGLYHRDGSPLTLSSSARGLFLRDAVSHSDFNNLALTAGGTYELTRNLRLSGNGMGSFTHTNNGAAQSFTGSAGVSWQADTLELAGLRYDRFGGVTAGAGTTTGTGSTGERQFNASAQIGHSMSRSWPLATQSALALTASQSLSMSESRNDMGHLGTTRATSRSVLHMLAATYNVARDNKSGYARASFSDSREIGGSHARFQLFNFQLSGTMEFSQHSSLNGDLTLQHTTQRSGDVQQAGLGLVVGSSTGANSVSGEVTYRHNRAFGIPRLRFSSRLKLAQDVLRQPGVMVGIPDHETRMWENRLDWSVGRLETGVLYRLSRIDGRTRDFLMLRLQRNFGE